jgi:hypothetical protein
MGNNVIITSNNVNNVNMPVDCCLLTLLTLFKTEVVSVYIVSNNVIMSYIHIYIPRKHYRSGISYTGAHDVIQDGAGWRSRHSTVPLAMLPIVTIRGRKAGGGDE